MASQKKPKAITLNILPEEIIGSEITRSGDYRYASVGIKQGKDQYMRISYEWKGDTNIPEFVMNIMGWISSSEDKDVIKESIEKHTEEYDALKERM